MVRMGLLWLTVGGLANGVFAQSAAEKTPNKIVCARLHYLKAAKKQVAGKHWPLFGNQAWEGELRYFTPNSFYLVNPQKSTLRQLPNERLERCACKGFTVFQVKDTLHPNFEMNTNFADGIAACSDLDVSRTFVPGVDDTENWASMVIHEMFHQFQSNHAPFRQRAIALLTSGQYLGQDSLARCYERYPDFQRAIKQENAWLLSCLAETNSSAIDSLLALLLTVRQNRLTQFKQDAGFDPTDYENFEQIAEAGTRYVEYHFSDNLKHTPPDPALASLDTAYHHHRAFQQYTLQSTGKYLFTVSRKYFYALGFNSMQLLDKLGVPFREQAYSQPDYSFTKAFRQYLDKRK